MFFINSLNFISKIFLFFIQKTKKIYLNSNIYNKKISIISNNSLKYRPNPSLLDCLLKYKKKKIK